VRGVGELGSVRLALECAAVRNAVKDAAEERTVADDLRAGRGVSGCRDAGGTDAR
jgi:hypothetical protein